MTASSVGFRPMRRLDFKHNAADVELIHEIEKAYEPKVYFDASQPVYTDEHSVYGYVPQYGSDGEFALNLECDEVVTAFTRVPIPE